MAPDRVRFKRLWSGRVVSIRTGQCTPLHRYALWRPDRSSLRPATTCWARRSQCPRSSASSSSCLVSCLCEAHRQWHSILRSSYLVSVRHKAACEFAGAGNALIIAYGPAEVHFSVEQLQAQWASSRMKVGVIGPACFLRRADALSMLWSRFHLHESVDSCRTCC